MALKSKQIKQIKKEYPQKSVEQIAHELKITPVKVYKALGPAHLWEFRLEQLAGYLCCLLIGTAPFIFIRGISNFADLPQRAYIQLIASVLLVCWAAHMVCTKQVRVRNVISYSLVAAFIGWSFFTLVWSPYGYESFYASVHWAACGAVFFAISAVLVKGRWIENIMGAVCLAAAGVILLGLGQQFLDLDWVPTLGTPAAAFANRNMASHYVAIILPILITMGFYWKKSIMRYPAWCFGVLGLLFIWYADTRASMVAVAGAAIWMGLIRLLKTYGKKFARIFYIAGVVVIAAVIIAAVLSGAGKQIYGMVQGSAKYRLLVWQNSLEMIKERPLQGFGAGGFKLFYSIYSHKIRTDNTFGKEKQIRRVHNDYIQTAVELGLIGFVLFSAILVYALFMAVRFLSRSEDKQQNSIVVGLSAGIIAFMVTALFSFPAQRSIPPLMIMCYVSILTILYSRTFGGGCYAKLKMPRELTIGLLVLLFASGIVLNRFNWSNIICDRYLKTALHMEKTKKNRRALEAGLTAQKYNKYRTDVMSAIGHAYVATNNPHKAIDVLEKLMQKHQYNLNALFILASAYANAGNNKKALETLQKVLRIKPSFKEAQKVVFLLKAYGKARINLR